MKQLRVAPKKVTIVTAAGSVGLTWPLCCSRRLIHHHERRLTQSVQFKLTVHVQRPMPLSLFRKGRRKRGHQVKQVEQVEQVEQVVHEAKQVVPLESLVSPQPLATSRLPPPSAIIALAAAPSPSPTIEAQVSTAKMAVLPPTESTRSPLKHLKPTSVQRTAQPKDEPQIKIKAECNTEQAVASKPMAKPTPSLPGEIVTIAGELPQIPNELRKLLLTNKLCAPTPEAPRARLHTTHALTSVPRAHHTQAVPTHHMCSHSGCYTKRVELVNGYPSYVNTKNCATLLWRTKDGHWMVGRSADAGEVCGHLCVKDEAHEAHRITGSWMVAQTSSYSSEWVPAAKVKVLPPPGLGHILGA
jgi:hypothetical protein